MSYGMNHEEFTAATGLGDGDPVTLTVPGEAIRRAVVQFSWVGADFAVVGILYDSDQPGFPDGSKYVHRRRRYAHRMPVHFEYNTPIPFNSLRPGVVVEANGRIYGDPVGAEA